MTQINTNQAKIIKRYANRKLYDTEESSYVTLTKIAETVASGRAIQVIDNVTKEDITGPTLLSVLVETETDLTNQVDTLSNILKAGGLRKYVGALKGGGVNG